jgi:DNA-binding NtrC family response regulator
MKEKSKSTSPGKAAPPGRPPVALRFASSGRVVPLPEDIHQFPIGTDPVNYLVLDDQYVSRLHCVLERASPSTLVVRDRGSLNGTLVNGGPIRECEIGAGARIRLGATTLVVIGAGSGPRAASEELLSQDERFRAAVDKVVRAAQAEVSILVLGESGTGKELVARMVHEASPRAAGPFVVVNCATLSPHLVASELFGHERGAFTGAAERHVGIFEQAHGGTLFLDEIGELPLEQQPALLRVIETQRVRRVGAQEERPIDVRIVAATNRDLRASGDREFRADLYHRLAGLEVRLPPLRERPSDIVMLARRFAADLDGTLGARTIAPSAFAMLLAHTWPGNVRELRNAIYRAALLNPGELAGEDLLEHLVSTHPEQESARLAEPTARYATVDEVLRDLIERSLLEHGSLRRAAKAIGMPRSTFHDHMRRLGIRRRDST